jgi:hypothetical protein
MPSLEAVSEAEAAIITEFVMKGGTVVITGPNPSGLTEIGTPATNYALSNILGFSKSSAVPVSFTNRIKDGGQVVFFKERKGLNCILKHFIIRCSNLFF